jgi:hypothetical protein
MMQLVCSNKPRPSVQKGAKGNQFWKRDVHHIARGDRKTLCNIDASEWLEMGAAPLNAVQDPNLCIRCKAAILS